MGGAVSLVVGAKHRRLALSTDVGADPAGLTSRLDEPDASCFVWRERIRQRD
jgi:hypothetical protein